MTPRFERRPDKRTESGAKVPLRGGRFRPRREERPHTERPDRAERPARSEWSERSERPQRPERPEWRSGPRRVDRAELRGESRSGGRGEVRRPGSGSERSGGRRPFVARAGRGAGGERPARSPLPTRGPVLVDAPSPLPAAEAERFSSAVSTDLVWGRHAALATLESGRPIHRIWCTAEMRFSPRFLQLLRDAKGSGVLVEEVTWARLGQISGGAVHQGIVLQTAAAETLDLHSLIDGCRALTEPPLLMAVDGLTDPHNLGAIVRSAEALGAHGLVLPQRRNAGLTGTVAKVAAGALENLPVARVVNLNRSLEVLKGEGYRVIGLAGEGTLTLEEADLDGPLVVVTGSEAEGLSMLTRRTCDQLVRIPLRGATPSLNASVATALLLYEVARRSWMKGIRGCQPAPRISRVTIPNDIAAAAASPAPATAPPPLEGAPLAPPASETADAAIPVIHPPSAPEPPESAPMEPLPVLAEPLPVLAEPLPVPLEQGATPEAPSSFDQDIQL